MADHLLLWATNRFVICAKPVASETTADCGTIEAIEAASFHILAPIMRRKCLLDECEAISGPVDHLTEQDLSDASRKRFRLVELAREKNWISYRLEPRQTAN